MDRNLDIGTDEVKQRCCNCRKMYPRDKLEYCSKNMFTPADHYCKRCRQQLGLDFVIDVAR